MAEDTKIDSIISGDKTRRSLVKTAAQVAVTAPAVGLLLSASTRPASAQHIYGAGDAGGPTDNAFLGDDVANLGIPNDDFIVGDDTF
jgi:hypothetical protein